MDDFRVIGPVNAASALYNSMIHPLFPQPIFGGIWYQGRSDFIAKLLEHKVL